MMKKVSSPTIVLILIALLFSCKKHEFKVSDKTSDRFYVKNSDYPIPVWVRGNTASKKIILYIQGGPGSNTLDFAEIDYPGWSNTLEKEYALAYYDQRGTGNRQGSFKVDDINMDVYIDDLHKVAQFIKTAYKAEVIMMGHSFGGQLMYRYMLKHKNDGVPVKYISVNGVASNDTDTLRWRFRRNFLFNTAGIEISNGKNVAEWNEVLNWLSNRPSIVSSEDKAQWNTFVEKLVYNYYPEKSVKFREYFKVIFASSYNPLPSYLNGSTIERITENLFRDINSFGLVNKLSGIDQNVLLITGRYDDVCPPEELEFIYSRISSTSKQIKILENSGHESFNHQPSEFQNLVRNYIQ